MAIKMDLEYWKPWAEERERIGKRVSRGNPLDLTQPAGMACLWFGFFCLIESCIQYVYRGMPTNINCVDLCWPTKDPFDLHSTVQARRKRGALWHGMFIMGVNLPIYDITPFLSPAWRYITCWGSYGKLAGFKERIMVHAIHACLTVSCNSDVSMGV